MTKSNQFDDEIKKLAEDFITTYHCRAGSRSYAWDEENDYSTDDLNVATGECPPSDCDSYSWWEIVSCDIQSSEIESRNDKTAEYCVEVDAWVAVVSGNEDEDIEQMEETINNITPDLRTFYVHVERGDDDDLFVVGIEE